MGLEYSHRTMQRLNLRAQEGLALDLPAQTVIFTDSLSGQAIAEKGWLSDRQDRPSFWVGRLSCEHIVFLFFVCPVRNLNSLFLSHSATKSLGPFYAATNVVRLGVVPGNE